MANPETVQVFSFRAFDLDINDMRVSKYKATREAIASHLGGEVLEGTAHDVSPDEIDGQGRYRRVATGWGELN